jgi:hypothetical protein
LVYWQLHWNVFIELDILHFDVSTIDWLAPLLLERVQTIAKYLKVVCVRRVRVFHNGDGVLGSVGNDNVDNLKIVCIDLIPLGQLSECFLRFFIGVELIQALKAMHM